MNLGDLTRDIEELKKEIESWNLSDDNDERFQFLLKSLFLIRAEFHQEIIGNRDFCPVCSTKILAQKTLDAQPIIDFLDKIQKAPVNLESFLYFSKELFFLTYSMGHLEKTGFDYLIAHLNDYITLRYPQIKNKKEKVSILNLRLTCLGINSLLSELMAKILDFITIYVYNMKLDKEVEIKVITFIIERVLASTNKFTIIHFETQNIWRILFNKFENTYEGLDLCDPLIITKEK